MKPAYQTAELIKLLDELSYQEQPIIAVQLLKFRSIATYGSDVDEPPCSGRAAFRKYVTHITPLLHRLGVEFITRIPVEFTFHGMSGESWDTVSLLKWPTPKYYKQFLASQEFKQAAHHRDAGIFEMRILVGYIKS